MSAAFALCALSVLCASAGPPSPTPWILQVGLTGDQLLARTNALRDQGFQPRGVCGYNVVETSRFAAIWEKRTGPTWTLDYGLTPDRLDSRALELKRDGFRPVVLSGYDLVGAQGFADLWRKEPGPAWSVEYGIDSDGLRQKASRMTADGFRPRSLSSYISGTISRYAVVWEKSDVPWRMRWGLTSEELESALKDLSNLGYRPVALTAMGFEERLRYAAVWEKRKGPAWVVRYNLTADGVANLAQSMQLAGYRPVQVTGYGTLSGTRFATLWEKQGG